MRGWNYACGKALYPRPATCSEAGCRCSGNYACGKALYPRQRLPFVNRGGRDPGTTPAEGLGTFDHHPVVLPAPASHGATPAEGLGTVDDASLAAANIGRGELCLREGFVSPTSGTSSPCQRKGLYFRRLSHGRGFVSPTSAPRRKPSHAHETRKWGGSISAGPTILGCVAATPPETIPPAPRMSAMYVEIVFTSPSGRFVARPPEMTSSTANAFLTASDANRLSMESLPEEMVPISLTGHPEPRAV